MISKVYVKKTEIGDLSRKVSLHFYGKYWLDVTIGNIPTFTIDLESLVNNRIIYGYFINELGDLVKCDINQLTARGGEALYSLLRLTGNCRDYALSIRRKNNIVCIIVGSGLGECNTEFTEYENKFPADIYKEAFNSFSAEMEAGEAIFNAKNNILISADPNSCLAYMEAQLDLTTTILFSVLSKLPPAVREEVEADCAFLDVYEQAFKNASVTNVKSISKCMDEFNTKLQLRNLQKIYYGEKEKLEKLKEV